MGFLDKSKPREKVEITADLEIACADYSNYIKYILEPAKIGLEGKVESDEVRLYEVFGANLIAAHSVDYLIAVRSALGVKESRRELLRLFDEKFSVPGAYIKNRKMELIDAINNALKHIRVEPTRYRDLGDRYGQISFQSLVEDGGRVMCHLDSYLFDYCRVVLLPALNALSGFNLNDVEGVVAFAKGELAWNYSSYVSDEYDPNDPSTAIDRMIEICSSPCVNCEEAADECRCSQYVFAGSAGKFEPLYSASSGEFEELMDQISPSYRRA